MHASLKTKTNVRLLAAWAIALILVVAISTPATWGTVALGGALGLIGGTLQLNAMRVSAVQLIAATTLMEVRRGFSSSTFGRAYLFLFWATQITLLIASVLIYRSRVFVAVVAGYLAFAVIRELVSILGTRQLERRASVQA